MTEFRVDSTAAERLLRVGVLALVAPVGVLIGHALTYLFVVPDPVVRAGVLAASGHGWWAFGAVAGGVFAAAGAVLFLVAVLRRPPDGGRFRRELSRWLWPRLAACQLGMFVVVETVERAVVGHPVGGDLYHEIIEHGVLAQASVAFVVTGLCWWLAWAVDLACVVISFEPVPIVVGLAPVACCVVLPPWVCRHLVEARAPPFFAV